MSLSPLYPDLANDLHVSTAFGPPSRFPLTSTGLGKARHLSGPSECALLQIPIPQNQDRALLHRGRSYESQVYITFITHNYASRLGVSVPNTRTFGGLLGPCFKTGGMRSYKIG